MICMCVRMMMHVTALIGFMHLRIEVITESWYFVGSYYIWGHLINFLGDYNFNDEIPWWNFKKLDPNQKVLFTSLIPTICFSDFLCAHGWWERNASWEAQSVSTVVLNWCFIVRLCLSTIAPASSVYFSMCMLSIKHISNMRLISMIRLGHIGHGHIFVDQIQAHAYYQLVTVKYFGSYARIFQWLYLSYYDYDCVYVYDFDGSVEKFQFHI